MGGCTRCVQISVLITNGILLLVGFALVGVAGATLAQLPSVAALRSTPLLVLSVGAVLVAIGCAAVLGVCCASRPLLLAHSLLLTLLVLLQLALALGVYLARAQLFSAVVGEARDEIQLYGRPEHKRTTSVWDLVQMQFDCCGIDNYTNWLDTEFGQADSSTPYSCCLVPTANCSVGAAALPPSEAARIIHTTGCVQAVSADIQRHLPTVAATIAVLVGVQVLGIMLVCCLLRSSKYDGYSRASVTI